MEDEHLLPLFEVLYIQEVLRKHTKHPATTPSSKKPNHCGCHSFTTQTPLSNCFTKFYLFFLSTFCNPKTLLPPQKIEEFQVWTV
jgi:hypothetical protein